MPGAALKLRIPIGVQVGVVAALFVAAILVLWTTGASVVAREHRRAEAKGMLEQAGTELEARGRAILAEVRPFPESPEAQSREEVERKLSATASESLSRYEGIEGGYLVLRFKRLLGTYLLKNGPASSRVGPAERGAQSPARGHGEAGLRPREADLIDIQVDAAIRRKQVLFSIEELEGAGGVTVAIRTSPIVV